MTADVAQADAFANGQRQVREADRVALVAALHLPPETTWEEALARVAPVAAGAKGCHGCAHRVGESIACSLPLRTSDGTVGQWQDDHLSDDGLTPKPNAPECPGRVER